VASLDVGGVSVVFLQLAKHWTAHVKPAALAGKQASKSQ
jgi:hypothetical protein